MATVKGWVNTKTNAAPRLGFEIVIIDPDDDRRVEMLVAEKVLDSIEIDYEVKTVKVGGPFGKMKQVVGSVRTQMDGSEVPIDVYVEESHTDQSIDMMVVGKAMDSLEYDYTVV